eukprot:g1813.t1
MVPKCACERFRTAEGVRFLHDIRWFSPHPDPPHQIEFSEEKPEDGVQHLSVLRGRDKDGKRIYLDVSVQYRLSKDKVGQIYKEKLSCSCANEGVGVLQLRMLTFYEDIYISELRDALSKACNYFAIADAWESYLNEAKARAEQRWMNAQSEALEIVRRSVKLRNETEMNSDQPPGAGPPTASRRGADRENDRDHSTESSQSEAVGGFLGLAGHPGMS